MTVFEVDQDRHPVHGEYEPQGVPTDDEARRFVELIDAHITGNRSNNTNDGVIKALYQEMALAKRAVRIFEPDDKGNREVLYMDMKDRPQTAYVNPKTGGVTLGESW